MNYRPFLYKLVMPKGADGYTADLINRGECKTALDIGCGSASHLSAFRPQITSIGIDANQDAVSKSKANDLHDHYLVSDVLKQDITDIKQRLNGKELDIVTLYGVIEHFPKADGYKLLEKCEQLTSKYILLETPNGFFPQGPEFGNEYQRHLSGWFRNDLEGLGYSVFGTSGTKLFRGHDSFANFKFFGSDIPCIIGDVLASWLLRISRNPQRAFNLVAIKDV